MLYYIEDLQKDPNLEKYPYGDHKRIRIAITSSPVLRASWLGLDPAVERLPTQHCGKRTLVLPSLYRCKFEMVPLL